MSETQTDEYRRFVSECKKCLISPQFFKRKEAVETTAKEVYQFFKDNPKADYVAFFGSLRELSSTPGTDRTKQSFCIMEEILEYSGLIPPVRAKLCQKIVEQSFGGVGTGVVAKILNIPERVVINVKRWRSKDNLKSLYDEFAEKFLNDSPKSLDELLDALILYRKDFNAKYVAKVAASFPEVGAVKNGRKKLVRKKQKRIHDLKKGVFNWDDEIDFQESSNQTRP